MVIVTLFFCYQEQNPILDQTFHKKRLQHILLQIGVHSANRGFGAGLTQEECWIGPSNVKETIQSPPQTQVVLAWTVVVGFRTVPQWWVNSLPCQFPHPDVRVGCRVRFTSTQKYGGSGICKDKNEKLFSKALFCTGYSWLNLSWDKDKGAVTLLRSQLQRCCELWSFGDRM